MTMADWNGAGNDPMYVQRLARHERMIRLLALHGIAYEPVKRRPQPAEGHGGWRRQMEKPVYRFRVADLQAEPLSGELSAPPAEGAEAAEGLARMKRLAARAAYAAGLDDAEVWIRRDGRQQAAVVRIAAAQRTPSPARQSITGPLLLGMDPEFLMLSDRGKVVPASRYLDDLGKVGFDSATVPGRPDIHPLAELRPAPSGEPGELVRNLRRTMWQAAARIGDTSLRWVAGGMPVRGLPLGGHIHFSGVPLHAGIVRALDNYLAMPLMLLEQPSGIARRRKYGRLGDVRLKSYGGFEYRTLPSLLLSPTLTKGALAMAKLIAGHSRLLTKRFLDQERYVRAYYQGDKQMLLEPVERVWRELVRLPDYERYAADIARVKRWIDERRVWDETADFRIYWRIPPYD